MPVSHNHVRGLVLILATALLTADSAVAAPYWVAWEGNDYPENEGWHRINFGVGPAVRTLENGIMTIDSLWSEDISDSCRMERPIDPEPGELFVAEWRFRVVENIGGTRGDSGVTIAPDSPASLGLRYMEESFSSVFEPWSVEIEPGVFHTYRLTSTDMLSYTLSVDGDLVIHGNWFVIGGNQSFFAWGDAVRGARSRTEWDYVRFGVVPESSTLALIFCLVLHRRSYLR